MKNCPAAITKNQQTNKGYFEEKINEAKIVTTENPKPSLSTREIVNKLFEWKKTNENKPKKITQPIETSEIKKAEKHERQIEKIIEIIEQDLLHKVEKERKIIFVEFGAGKANLSAKLHEKYNNENIYHLLIDRSTFRNKAEKKLSKQNKDIENIFKRIQIDILNLNLKTAILSEFPFYESDELTPHLVFISKHLCGMALDLTFRCFTQNYIFPSSSFYFIPCCHHRCIFTEYSSLIFF